jgi:hypothetical protein
MSTSCKSDNLSDLSKPGKARKASNPAESITLNFEGLNDLAKNLDQQEIEHEHELRRELEAVEGRLCADRREKGRVLASYRAIYKPKRTWHAFCKAIGLNKRSALRIIGDYTAAKALPKAIRDAANSRGIDIAAMKNRPLLEKLIDLGFEDGANADDLIQSGLDELAVKEKSKKTARSLSPDRRHQKACDYFLKLHPDHASTSYLIGLDEMCAALMSRYQGRARNEFLVDGQTNFFDDSVWNSNLESWQGASLRASSQV